MPKRFTDVIEFTGGQILTPSQTYPSAAAAKRASADFSSSSVSSVPIILAIQRVRSSSAVANMIITLGFDDHSRSQTRVWA